MKQKLTVHEAILNSGFRKGFVADQLGVYPSTIIRWNNKETRPSKMMLTALCELLDIYEEEIDLKE